MPLVLRIENVDNLPDGGPVFVEIDRRGIDIGRDTYLDWTLPDPERFISGKHCEIHFREGGYWLHDVSTNGTTINNNPGRLTEPHCLAHGDRIHIGPYIVMAELSGVEAGPDGPGPIPTKGGTSFGGDPWGGLENPAEAIDRRDFAARSQASTDTRKDDLAEENISWGFGDVASTPPSPESDWSTKPASEPPASDAADWGAPPASPPPPASAPPASTPPAATPATGESVDWGAPPAAEPASGGSPWDVPAADSPAQPAAEIPAQPVATPTPEPTPVAEPAPPAESVGHNPFLAEPDPPAEPVPDPEPAAPPQASEVHHAEPASEPPVPEEPGPAPVAPPVAPERPVEQAPGLGEQWSAGAAAEPASQEPAPQQPAPQQPAPQQSAPQQPAAAPVEAPAVTAGTQQTQNIVEAFERGAGLPAGSVSGRSDEQFAEELGHLFRSVTQSLQAMLLARAETKSAMRSTERTMIGALENNPLKFSPTPEDAMRIMFGQKTRSYLDATQTVEQSFADLQKHQMLTFGAMQSALQVLIEDLDPENIAGATSKDGGLAGLVSSRRAKLWDTYVERFNAKSAHHDRGMIDAFMILFSEMYDRQG